MKRLIMLAALPALLLAGCAAQSAASGTETLTVTGNLEPILFETSVVDWEDSNAAMEI